MVAGLARELESLRRRLDQLQSLPTRVEQLADLFARHTETLATTTSAPATPALPSWLDLPAHPGRPAESSQTARPAEELLTTLCRWVGGIYLRYPDAAQTLPECWLWHPEIVEELLWLHTAWLAAYAQRAGHGGGGLARPAAPRRGARIRDYAGICSLEQHQPGPTATPRLATAPAHRRGAGDRRLVGQPPQRPAAGPHPEQLAAARRPDHRNAAADDQRHQTRGVTGRATLGWVGRTRRRRRRRHRHRARPVPGRRRRPASRTPIGWLYPLITDGLALVAYAATARLHAGAAATPPASSSLAAGLSGLAQAVYLAGGLDHTGAGAGRAAVRRRRLAGHRRRPHRPPAAPHRHPTPAHLGIGTDPPVHRPPIHRSVHSGVHRAVQPGAVQRAVQSARSTAYRRGRVQPPPVQPDPTAEPVQPRAGLDGRAAPDGRRTAADRARAAAEPTTTARRPAHGHRTDAPGRRRPRHRRNRPQRPPRRAASPAPGQRRPREQDRPMTLHQAAIDQPTTHNDQQHPTTQNQPRDGRQSTSPTRQRSTTSDAHPCITIRRTCKSRKTDTNG